LSIQYLMEYSNINIRNNLELLFDEVVRRSIRTLLILGPPDSGKSTLADALFDIAFQRQKQVGLIDEDLGQTRLGLPACVWGAISNRCKSQVVYGEFIGSLTPAGHETAFLAAVLQTKTWLESMGVSMIIIDSPGFIFGKQATSLHQQQVSLLHPDWILALEGESTLAPLLQQIGFPWVKCLPAEPSVQPRSLSVRRRNHQKRFDDYFKQSRIVNVSLQNRLCWFLNRPLTHADLDQSFVGHILAFASNPKPVVGQIESMDQDTLNLHVRIPKGISFPEGAITIGTLRRAQDGTLSHEPNLADSSNIRLHFGNQEK